MSYRFTKLYSDLVADDGTVVVAYAAWLDLFGSRTAYAGVELYGPDGSRDVIRARQVEHQADANGVEIVLDVPSGRFTMSQRTIHGGWIPSGGTPHRHLDWRVVCARASSVARFDGRELHGIGYSDWVEVGCATRSLGLSELQWGRVHLDDSTVVFNSVRFRSGRSWSRIAEWSVRGPRELGDVDVVGLKMARARTLHAGNPIDPQRFPGRFERALSRMITGPADEDRRLSHAHVPHLGDDARGWALHETVSFGRQAAA
jgi:hypothetical protein